MTTSSRSFAADIRQAMNDWDKATPAQRAEALEVSGKLAAEAERRVFKFGIVAVRSGSSVFGAARAWVKDRAGEPETFDNRDDAETEAECLNKATVSPNVYYFAKPFGGEA